MEDFPNWINICPTNPIQFLKLRGFFEDFVCVLQMILLTKILKNTDVSTVVPQQIQEVYYGLNENR